jgi:hypothetical protein
MSLDLADLKRQALAAITVTGPGPPPALTMIGVEAGTLLALLDRLEKAEAAADGGVMWAQNAETFRLRAEKAEADLKRIAVECDEWQALFEKTQAERDELRVRLENSVIQHGKITTCNQCGSEVSTLDVAEVVDRFKRERDEARAVLKTEVARLVAANEGWHRRISEIRNEAIGIAMFYVPGETQSSQADTAPSLRTAWSWGTNHAATQIAAAIRARFA